MTVTFKQNYKYYTMSDIIDITHTIHEERDIYYFLFKDLHSVSYINIELREIADFN